jgi:hypothetical protein
MHETPDWSNIIEKIESVGSGPLHAVVAPSAGFDPHAKGKGGGVTDVTLLDRVSD